MQSIPRPLLVAGAILAAAAVISQFVLMLQNRVAPVAETVIRFFSFFTILTNSLVALFCITRAWFPGSALGRYFGRYTVFSAITVYIVIVGGVYQVALRQVWEPEGLQLLVDEALHTMTPAYMLILWLRTRPTSRIAWQGIPLWLVYPLVYFGYVLIRGAFSGFYPYPFVDVEKLGMAAVLRNASVIVLAFLFCSVLLAGIANFRVSRV